MLVANSGRRHLGCAADPLLPELCREGQPSSLPCGICAPRRSTGVTKAGRRR